jgi:serine protease inhibitor
MTKDEIKQLITETSKATVSETLRGLGIDADNPLETQKDFQSLHDWRVSIEKIRHKAILSAVGVVVVGALAALWLGIKSIVLN